MTPIEAIYGAIKDQLAAIPNVRGYDYSPEAPEFPCFFLEMPVITPEDLANGMARLEFEAVFLVASVEFRYQKSLWRFQELTGPSSVLAMLQAHRNLGFSDVDVLGGVWRPLGLEEVSFYRGFGAACTVSVLLG